jgi:hypothetical protein
MRGGQNRSAFHHVTRTRCVITRPEPQSPFWSAKPSNDPKWVFESDRTNVLPLPELVANLAEIRRTGWRTLN